MRHRPFPSVAGRPGTPTVRRRGRRLFVGVALSLAVAFQPSPALAEAYSAPQNAHSSAQNGNATAAYATIQITGSTTTAPVHTPPDATSVPTGWSCTDETDNATYLQIACTPLTGNWFCPAPYVLTSYEGSSLDTITGTSKCGTTQAQCQPGDTGLPQDYCEDHIGGPANMPFVCRADYYYYALVSTTTWTVLCRTYNPSSARASTATYAGLDCGFNTTSDPTGIIVQDPNTQFGEVRAGPWTVVGATSVTMTCVISVGDPFGPNSTVVSTTTAGSVGYFASPVGYQVPPGQNVYLCTYVSWTGSLGGDSWDATPEERCKLAISISS